MPKLPRGESSGAVFCAHTAFCVFRSTAVRFGQAVRGALGLAAFGMQPDPIEQKWRCVAAGDISRGSAETEEFPMEKKYYNVMESVVETTYEQMKDSLGVCACEQCRNDVIALALNYLPPRYVSTASGELYSKVSNSLNPQSNADVRKAVAQAAEQVRRNPRHGN